MKKISVRSIILILCLSAIACVSDMSANKEMISLLAQVYKSNYSQDNTFCPEAKMEFYNSKLKTAIDKADSSALESGIARTLLELGEEEKSLEVFEQLLNKIPDVFLEVRQKVMKEQAMAYMRLGERTNCILQHAGQSCIFPIKGRGVHSDKTGSERAIMIYEKLLAMDTSDLESRWLLNIAYMTLGTYPHKVPPALLIKGLDTDTVSGIKPFIDAAVGVGLNTNNMAGGTIIDDFNNDGLFDLVTSSWGLNQGMHYCRNNGNGSFTDVSDSSGLKALTGGLNIMQTDYNNDGLKDIFVLRGAWKGEFGKEPNSLLRNNGNGTFTDVTHVAGLISMHPTQAATWADFNSDGWLDVFIGNETSTNEYLHPSEFYINNRNGTFTEVSALAGCNVIAFVKGVTSGDYNNDGRPDIFVSTLNGQKILLKNTGNKNGIPLFIDETIAAGLNDNKARTFPTWFWDYDNDGWLDILVCGYEFDRPLAFYAAAEALNRPLGNTGKVFLFRNKQDGTFEDISEKVGLNKIAFAMGSNFGDIDNDGFLDMYLGTGNPPFQSLVPNKMFKNIEGKKFIDVTTSARVGNLQKGHAVSFADFDSDGDQDIYIDMGGAYEGDAYQNSLYINPGQAKNNWIDITLEGVKANRLAIGAKIKITFVDKGVKRSVYRDVNSGGSFGSNPLLQHIGIGQAELIESMEIRWPGSNTTQYFGQMPANRCITLKEGGKVIPVKKPEVVDFTLWKGGIIGCAPSK